MDFETSVHNNFGDFIFGHVRWTSLKWIELELGSAGSQFSRKVAKAQRTAPNFLLRLSVFARSFAWTPSNCWSRI
jgi:hypothetical protein